MPPRHITQHTADTEGDALDSYHHQDEILRGLAIRWHSDINQWDRGTLIKLVLEHAAVREAAVEVLAEHLQEADQPDAARRLLADCERRRHLLASLDHASVGVEPAGLAADADIEGTVVSLFNIFQAERSEAAFSTDLDAVVAPLRSDLPSAERVRKHAPTRPGEHQPRWYDGMTVATRLHAAYDRMRGFPWPESAPFMDDQLAGRVDEHEA